MLFCIIYTAYISPSIHVLVYQINTKRMQLCVDQLPEVPMRRYAFINANSSILAIQPHQKPAINYVIVSAVLDISAKDDSATKRY